MDDAKELKLQVANHLALVAMGICYVQAIRLGMSFAAGHFPQSLPAATKMLLTGSSTGIAMTIVFAFNRFVLRQSMLGLGLNCGFVAFVYFYVIHPWPNIFEFVLAVRHSYSLFALLAFTVAPVLVGAICHRRLKPFGIGSLPLQGQ